MTDDPVQIGCLKKNNVLLLTLSAGFQCFFMFLYLFTSPCSVCDSGKWQCSENFCPARCVVEGQYVTTYDGKQYSVPGKCTYMASQVTHFCLNHYLAPTLLYKLTARLYSFRVTTGGYTLSISKGRPLWRQSLFSFFRYKQSETVTLITFNQITFNTKGASISFPFFFCICEFARKRFNSHTALSELERKKSQSFINLVIKFGQRVVSSI